MVSYNHVGFEDRHVTVVVASEVEKVRDFC